jgi:hypothetical protein
MSTGIIDLDRLTVRELGDLAESAGLTLLDLLARESALGAVN